MANRTMVSLRVPSGMVTYIEQYAAENDMRKTDAYLHFLQLGIDESSNEKLESAIDEMLRQISDIHATVVGRSDATIARDLEREQVFRVVAEESSRYSAIQRANIFGSFAKGTFTNESDIDIRIELDPAVPFNLHDLEHFSKAIEQQTGREVDVLSARTIKNKALANAVEKDKVTVYERKEH